MKERFTLKNTFELGPRKLLLFQWKEEGRKCIPDIRKSTNNLE
jgi:hypothetical protein